MTDEKNPRDHFAPRANAQQEALWDGFVEEYVKDWNIVQAAMRVGFNRTFAEQYGKLFMEESYVQRKIMEYKQTPDATTPDDVMKKRIEATYLMAMESGDMKAAVAAAKGLAQMRGLDGAPDRSGEQLRELVDAFKEVARVVPD